nr:DUF4136 domain-containing protein [Polymorphobacter sp.]
MNPTKAISRAILPLTVAALLAGCAPTFEARVARFSSLPTPPAKSFIIEPGDPAKVGGLEFATYANLVRKQMLANGFTEAASPGQAEVTVQFDYNVGPPRERIQTRPGTNMGWNGGWGAPGWGGPGWGWNPYWGAGWGGGAWGGGWGGGWSQPEVYSVTQFNSQVAMKMYRNVDKASVFEGRAETVSSSNNLTQLVPNLVIAMFTKFPGNSGETVRVRFNPNRPDQPGTVRPIN